MEHLRRLLLHVTNDGDDAINIFQANDPFLNSPANPDERMHGQQIFIQ